MDGREFAEAISMSDSITLPESVVRTKPKRDEKTKRLPPYHVILMNDDDHTFDYVIHMMQRRAEAGLLDAAATFFHHATPGLGPKIELYQNREWGEKNRERAIDGMRYLDQVLTKQPFLAGGDFTMADITAFAGLAYVAIAKIGVPAGLDNLKFWRERVASRPSIARA